MKIVVIGGTGLIGSRLVKQLRDQKHEVVAASLDTGVNTMTGQGLEAALQGASVVVDVSNSSFDETAAMNFFTTSTRNLLEYEATAGVQHHVALSVVGTDRLAERKPSDGAHSVRGYFRAKLAQEHLIEKGPIPYSIVHATQFFEFVKGMEDVATDEGTVRVAPVLIQPMAADDVARALARVATGKPVNGIVEVGGPQQFRLDDLIRQDLRARHDSRQVLTDSRAGYYGLEVDDRTLVPAKDARLGEITFDRWLGQPAMAR